MSESTTTTPEDPSKTPDRGLSAVQVEQRVRRLSIKYGDAPGSAQEVEEPEPSGQGRLDWGTLWKPKKHNSLRQLPVAAATMRPNGSAAAADVAPPPPPWSLLHVRRDRLRIRAPCGRRRH